MEVFGRITRDMSFEDWLFHNYQTTPAQVQKIMLATGTQKQADSCMDWYRKRYYRELLAVRELHQLSLFEGGKIK